ncbi:Transcriptional regulator XRE family, partial [Dysosmobacter welbionis]
MRVFACGSCFFAAAAAQSKPAMGLLPHFARRVFPSAADDNLAGRSADLPAAFRKGVISCMDHFKKRDTCCGAE